LTEDHKRPNSNYNLSYPDKPEGESKESATFYYNRERRLASAPKAVQDLYKETKPGRFGLFGVLVADRPRRALFFTILILCAIIIIVSRIGLLETTAVLDGNKLDISGTIFEDATIVLIKKTARKADAFTGEVNVFVSEHDMSKSEEVMPVFSHRIYFSLEKNEAYRFAVPYNSGELWVFLENDKSKLLINFKPE